MSDNERTLIFTEKLNSSKPKESQFKPYLIQISGRETGQMYCIEGKEIVIGRDAQCDIVVDDPHVSRVHAQIECHDSGEIYVSDRRSTNGIFVNGNKVEKHQLLDGDKLLVGTRLYFKFTYQDVVEENYQQGLYRAANVDELTQLYNRKYFTDVLSKELSFSTRSDQPLTLLMMDIDFFKKINDTYGHLGGDLVLKTVGNYLLNRLRLENISCRYGGEEFAIIMRNANHDVALRIAERLRKDISELEIDDNGQKIPITVSIGVACNDEEKFHQVDDFIRRADENLYTAKEQGRNRVVYKKVA